MSILSHLQEKGLVVATHNEGKRKEMEDLLAPYAIRVFSAKHLDLPEPEETGVTFTENASIKSRAAAMATSLPALADDSGLGVVALGGAPGIYSARWANGSYTDAFARIEKELRATGREPTGAAAYFACALCLTLPEGNETVCEGRVDGTLTFPPSGPQGFGYDPIFMPDGYDVTFGEMPAAEKKKLSHRTRAFEALKHMLFASL